jgi:transcriptional regulator with XRE-family HTH domain
MIRINGHAMRAIRRANAWTVEDCAAAIDLTPSAWSRWEHEGTVLATPVRLAAVAEVLGVDQRALLMDPRDEAPTAADQTAMGASANGTVNEVPR